MKRIGRLFDSIASFENLYRAYLRARRGKRDRASVDRFSFDLEREIIALRGELLSGTYRPGPLFTFTIQDPKRRSIAAAPFRDRVLHHAILTVLEPHFERGLDPDSFACRKGLGLDAALERAKALARHSAWALKSDIERCFQSIDHRVLEDLLARRFKDAPLLDLLGRIIDHGGKGGKGLPIGSLTSQWFANIYLGELDRHVRHELRPRGYLRYMDDFALFEADRRRLIEDRRRISGWLEESLHLRLKESATQISRTDHGWPFLGFRVTRTGLRLRRGTWKRFRAGVGSVFHDYRRGRLSLEDLVRSVECRIAHLERAPTRGLRRREMRIAEL